MAPSFSGVWKLQTKYQYSSAFPIDTNLGAKGFFAGGSADAGTSNVVDVITIASTAANATDFGDLTATRTKGFATSNNTRGLITGGEGGIASADIIDYIELASAGNASDFGDLANHVTRREDGCAFASNVRAIFAGGNDNTGSGNIGFNYIDYVTIQTLGNAIDFGDLTDGLNQNAGFASSTRGISSGGYNDAGSSSNIIQYVTIASAGNATDFGDLTVARSATAGCASATRGLTAGGIGGSNNIIDYITIASTGNATDFGDLTKASYYNTACSNATKGLITAGTNNATQAVEFVTIATTGNSADFGDLSVARIFCDGFSDSTPSSALESFFAPAAIGVLGGGYANNEAESIIEYMNIASDGQVGIFGDLINPAYGIGNGAASTTRGISFGGYAEPQGGSNAAQDVIEFITFSTKGKATDFGNLASAKYNSAGFSSSTRGITGGGGGSSRLNVIEYVTIASAGNSTDFGDLSVAKDRFGGASSTTRGLFLGGFDGSNRLNVIEYVTIASTGNVTDFGDLLAVKYFPNALSSNTRALSFGGSADGNANQNVIEYVTIASTGNATDFGDLSSTTDRASGVSDKTTGLIHAAQLNLSVLQLDKVTIASTGNASDYGDLTAGNYGPKFAASNSHGGLS
tara:strand:- start:1964 stop:3865 length:1902 start_codon:yes stop_codon:yes gene_type:complete